MKALLLLGIFIVSSPLLHFRVR